MTSTAKKTKILDFATRKHLFDEWCKLEPDTVSLTKSDNSRYVLTIGTPGCNSSKIVDMKRLNPFQWDGIYMGVLYACVQRKLDLQTSVSEIGLYRVNIARQQEILLTGQATSHPGYSALDAYVNYLWRAFANPGYDNQNRL